MKQITKTPQILSQLRTAYGPDASLDDLVVFETVLANTQPLRKTGGIFKSARLAQSLLSEITAAINLESVPIQVQHDTTTLPFGRLFAAIMPAIDEVRGLFAVDAKAHPDIVQKINSGTLDQVSVGMVNKSLSCNLCNFDYLASKSMVNLFTLECDKKHKIGSGGVHVIVTGLDSLFETSLVGRGAVDGARIVGPSESAFQENHKLAASSAANGGHSLAVHLTATPVEEDDTMDLTVLTTKLSETSALHAVAAADVTRLTATNTELSTNLAAVTSERNDALAAKTTAEANLAAVTTERDALTTSVTAAVTALTSEATAVLTACGKNADEIAVALKDKDATGLLSIIQDNRAQFAAIIPVGGKAKSATEGTEQPARRSTTSSFSTRR